MNPHRPRRPRQDGAAIRYLNQWRLHVESTEQRVRKAGHLQTDCPCCDGHIPDDARDRLEGLMRNGGRRAHRLRAAVTQLDDRYRHATTERQDWGVRPWWHNRTPWA